MSPKVILFICGRNNVMMPVLKRVLLKPVLHFICKPLVYNACIHHKAKASVIKYMDRVLPNPDGITAFDQDILHLSRFQINNDRSKVTKRTGAIDSNMANQRTVKLLAKGFSS
jgi:hypothetical protein